MTDWTDAMALLGRALLALIFILAGVDKLTGYEATAAYMANHGIPAALLPLAILLEIGGGLSVLIGLFSRYAALALAAFCLLTAVMFHSNFADSVQMTLFLKNIALAGGFLILAARGPGVWALNAK